MDDQVVEFKDKSENVSGEEQMSLIAAHMAQGTSKESWWNLLTRRKGSVLLKVMPVSLFGGFCALILVVTKNTFECPEPPDMKQPEIVNYTGWPDSFLQEPKEVAQICWLLPELKHPFVVQIFGIILSFVIVARNNVAVNRYFSGMDNVHTMSSRWVDSFTSLMGFLRSSIDLHPANSKKQDACVAIGLALLHWGSLAHALAVNSLQATQLGLEEKMWEARISILRPPSNLSLDSTASVEEAIKKKATASAGSRAKAVKGAMIADRRLSIQETGVGVIKNNSNQMRDLGKLGVYGSLTNEEVQRLHGATDKVAIVMMWMEEAVSRGQVQGVILTAPPILARVYNELGNGLQGFNSAYRIALVPFPFCFSQMIGWCLVIFILLCPLVAYVFTGGEALTSTLTFITLMGFWGLNRIAIELENPFGCEVNHLPLAELHHAYVEAIGEMHIHPMPEYRWNQSAGAPALPQLRRNLVTAK
jgi:predicted membrane chloride channel (bestrophin family)